MFSGRWQRSPWSRGRGGVDRVVRERGSQKVQNSREWLLLGENGGRILFSFFFRLGFYVNPRIRRWGRFYRVQRVNVQ